MKKLFAVSALLLTSTLAQAGGYQLQEYSTTNMGRAFAGAGIVGDDYSAIAFNPAGMELKNSGLTTIEIAKRIGVSPEMITQYRTTKKLPKLDTFAKLCKELDLDSNYILGLTKN
jgi:long-subunit fatty acid transport protein